MYPDRPTKFPDSEYKIFIRFLFSCFFFFKSIIFFCNIFRRLTIAQR